MATPKRKRTDLITEQKLAVSPAKVFGKTAVFSFEPPGPPSSSLDDGSSSPRTKVANKFRDLSLGSGGGVRLSSTTHSDLTDSKTIRKEDSEEQTPFSPKKLAVFDFNGHSDNHGDKNGMVLDEDDGMAVRKRIKACDMDTDHSPGVIGDTSADAVGPVQIDANGRLTLETAADPTMLRVTQTGGVDGLKKSYPSINRLSDTKSRSRRRGTPPISAARRKTKESVAEEEPVVVDPVRAALTWHEDEITVYDAEDKDDDGTGLNGIGFRPSAAVAYQRAQQRKKQLSDYKKREESEARALRNQKRREQLGERPGLESKHSVIRVRFSDADPETLITT